MSMMLTCGTTTDNYIIRYPIIGEVPNTKEGNMHYIVNGVSHKCEVPEKWEEAGEKYARAYRDGFRDSRQDESLGDDDIVFEADTELEADAYLEGFNA